MCIWRGRSGHLRWRTHWIMRRQDIFQTLSSPRVPPRMPLMLLLLVLAVPAWAESCYTADDMDAATKAALERSAQHYLTLATNQDFAALKQNSIPSLASNFTGIEAAFTENHASLQGGQSTIRSSYLLDASGTGTLQRAEFYCGIFNSPYRVMFVLTNLPAGRYGVVIQDAKGGKIPLVATQVLKEQQGSWLLAGLTLKATEIGGHDRQWFLEKARSYKTKGQNHNAWLYYLQAWELQAPVNYMYTAERDKIADEMQPSKPEDLPAPAKPMSLSLGANTYQITQMFPEAVGTDLYLIVKYRVADVSNTMQATQDNLAVIRGLVARYPELREAFAGIVARAVDPSGRDYGSLLAMKDVK